jgi:hypothetical protein
LFEIPANHIANNNIIIQTHIHKHTQTHNTYSDEPSLTQVEASKMMVYKLHRQDRDHHHQESSQEKLNQNKNKNISSSVTNKNKKNGSHPESCSSSKKKMKDKTSKKSSKCETNRIIDILDRVGGDYYVESAALLNRLRRKLLAKVPPPIQSLPPLPTSSPYALLINPNHPLDISSLTAAATASSTTTTTSMVQPIVTKKVVMKKKKPKVYLTDLKIPCPCATCDLTFPSYNIM